MPRQKKDEPAQARIADNFGQPKQDMKAWVSWELKGQLGNFESFGVTLGMECPVGQEEPTNASIRNTLLSWGAEFIAENELVLPKTGKAPAGQLALLMKELKHG